MTGPLAALRGGLGTDPALLKVTTGLRIGLALLILLVGTAIPDAQVRNPAYTVVGLLYLGAAVSWRLLLPRLPAPGSARIVGPAVDVGFLLTLAALSGGPTSLLQPVFFLLPVIVAFFGVPWATGLFGFVIAVGYLFTAFVWAGSTAPAPVIWLHFCFLIWLTAGTTTMSVVIVRREERLRSLERLQRNLVAQSLRIEERERTILAERLHDGPLQVLLAARMSLDVVTDQLHGLGSNADESVAELRSLKSDLRTAANDIRATVSGLHPQVLGQLGLVAGLRELTGEAERRTGAHVELIIDDRGPNPDESAPEHRRETDNLIYSAARELLVNIAKHAHARRITVTLRRGASGAEELTVSDDGVGFDPSVLPQRVADGHLGLGMHLARAAAAGGALDITSGGTGTTITLTLDPGADSPPQLERNAPPGPI
jgi:two-component system, NarL family, sensor kinase